MTITIPELINTVYDGSFRLYSYRSYATSQEAQRVVNSLCQDGAFSISRHYGGRFYVFVRRSIRKGDDCK